MSSTTLLASEQFEQSPEDGLRYELKDGELVRIGTAETGHARTKFRIGRCLIAHILQHPIDEAYPESPFALSPSRVCIPDVAFLRGEWVATADPGTSFSARQTWP
jgi:Uma2 family endonuclease